MITVRKMTHSLSDLSDHFFAFLIDFCFSALPTYVWCMCFLLVCGGFMNPRLFDVLLYASLLAMFLVGVWMMSTYTAKHYGQSWGGAKTGIRLIKRNGKKASESTIMLRQSLAIGLPLIGLGYFFNILGILVWFIVNGIVALCSKNQRTIVDHLVGTMFVHDKEEEYIW